MWLVVKNHLHRFVNGQYDEALQPTAATAAPCELASWEESTKIRGASLRDATHCAMLSA